MKLKLAGEGAVPKASGSADAQKELSAWSRHRREEPVSWMRGPGSLESSQYTLGRVGGRRKGSPASTEGLLRNNRVGQLLGVGGEGELFVTHIAQSP